ncbi:hypothetical protein [Streptantibioticus silvisoli]|uniref:Uncharacterized protein n=1 Tax=Streptantibioticus silvisoli TaxID=2705255 RepID=A0ABT6VW35_9ACTN|nr:hypothetical protein [Streptantibioticus silvisoli]MDI5962700.1 hypothetical protein [Streptantibioticus silvisoli]
MTGLAALGLDGVPLLDPLSYPGRPVPWPALLRGDQLLALRPPDGGPAAVGRWTAADGTALDALLAGDGRPGTGERVPVLAVGSNASPGQTRHKLLSAGVAVVVPMVPATVEGLGVGVSAHVSASGYVGAAPYAGPGTARVVVTWLDAEQLAVVDATEPNYRRVRLPAADFPVTLPDGTVPPWCDLYVNRHGVLAPDGVPLPATGQRDLLRDLLARSARLRDLLGPDPRAWVTRAAADPAVRTAAARAFTADGWLLRQPELMTRS